MNNDMTDKLTGVRVPTECPYCRGQGFTPLQYQFWLCTACGVVFKEHEEAHEDLAKSTYTTLSWGRSPAESMRQHGPRLRQTLEWANDASGIDGLEVLDIGAGVGVVEEIFNLRYPAASVTALEPVPALAKILRERDERVLETSFDSLVEAAKDPGIFKFDLVLCLGVDYLFKDLEKSLRYLSSIGRRTILQRAVFLDMGCFWGGKPIETFADLVAPNPLISLYMWREQYTELVGRYFTIEQATTFEERFQTGLVLSSMTLDLTPSTKHGPVPRPVCCIDKTMKRLEELDV